MNKELALKTIEGLKRDSLNCNVFSVYDYCDLSMQELLCTFFTKINQVVDATNKTVVIVDWLVNQGLSGEVAKKLNQWLQDGTLATIINETVFKELNAKITLLDSKITKIDSYRVNIKNFVLNSDGTIDVSDGFMKAFDYIEKLTLRDINLPWDSKTKGKIVLDLDNGRYLINKKIVMSANKMSLVTMENGTIVAAGDFNGTRMLDIGNGGHSYQNMIKNVSFIGNKRTDGIFLVDTLNTQIQNCMFLDIPHPINSETNCHETIIRDNYFLWSTYQTEQVGTAIRVGADAHILDNQIVGHAHGIELFSNANTVRGNHMYNLGGYGLRTTGDAMGNSIVDNYFDGCCVELTRGGYMTNLSDNNFVAMDKYCCVYMTQGKNPGGWAQLFTMQNNTIIPYSNQTPDVYPLNFTMQDGVITITNDKEFNSKMVGAIITDAYQDHICQIIGLYDTKKAKVKIFNGLQNGTHNGLFIKPTNVCFYSDRFTWANIVHEKINISNNRMDPGYEITSGNLNGLTKRMDRVSSSVGSIIERKYIEQNANVSKEVIVNFDKKPSFVQFECVLEGGKTTSSGMTRLTKNGQIENVCKYLISNSQLWHRLDNDCGCLVNEHEQAIDIRVSEFGTDYIKVNIISSATLSTNKKIKIDMYAY